MCKSFCLYLLLNHKPNEVLVTPRYNPCRSSTTTPVTREKGRCKPYIDGPTTSRTYTCVYEMIQHVKLICTANRYWLSSSQCTFCISNSSCVWSTAMHLGQNLFNSGYSRMIAKQAATIPIKFLHIDHSRTCREIHWTEESTCSLVTIRSWYWKSYTRIW